ncbi:MAG: hypothetical protein VKQ33_05435 [Candidatus Sericytochromatia bacterium]|nr:hypothetical protein [Candidatus Sericytochromatia bacterium]
MKTGRRTLLMSLAGLAFGLSGCIVSPTALGPSTGEGGADTRAVAAGRRAGGGSLLTKPEAGDATAAADGRYTFAGVPADVMLGVSATLGDASAQPHTRIFAVGGGRPEVLALWLDAPPVLALAGSAPLPQAGPWSFPAPAATSLARLSRAPWWRSGPPTQRCLTSFRFSLRVPCARTARCPHARASIARLRPLRRVVYWSSCP